MHDATIIWDDEPGANVEHIAEHGLMPEEVDSVLLNEDQTSWESRSSGRPCKFGWTYTGRYITVIWEEVHDDPRMIYPMTAYEVPPPA